MLHFLYDHISSSHTTRVDFNKNTGKIETVIRLYRHRKQDEDYSLSFLYVTRVTIQDLLRGRLFRKQSIVTG